MAVRLMKCHGGFQEMLEEATSERGQLQKECAELNSNIGLAMQQIHSREKEKAARVEARKPQAVMAPVALQVGAAWKNLNQHVGNRSQQVWVNLRQQVAHSTQGIVKANTFDSLINVKALLNVDSSADRAKQKQAERVARQATRRKAREEAKKQAEKAEADSDEPIVIGDRVAERIVLRKPAIAPPVIVARQPPALVKRKPIAMITATVVIEANIALADGRIQELRVHMADSCEEAARTFIQQHSQRQWFEKPLVAWLKKAEAEAIKLPFRCEASLIELRKQDSASKGAAA